MQEDAKDLVMKRLRKAKKLKYPKNKIKTFYHVLKIIINIKLNIK